MSEIIREKRLISLNSDNATQYLNGTRMLSNMSFDFRNILIPDPSILYVECGVQSAQIPASFYAITAINNTFNYTVNTIAYNIQVTPGNYNFNTLVTAMTTAFTVNAHTFTFVLNRASNILTMTLSSGTWNNILPSSIGVVLGFSPTTTYTIVANTITYSNLFDVMGPKKLKIFSSNMAIDSYDSINNSTTNLIETISVNVPGFSLILYQNIDGTYGHLRTHYLSTVDIQITDENNNPIDFNGVGWTITIVLILYKRLTIQSVDMPQLTNELPTDDTVTKG